MGNVWSKLKRIVRRDRGLPWRAAVAVSTYPRRNWPQIANPHRVTLLFWLYIAQAVAGCVVGFTAPFLRFFGVL
jgi:hypothetical protein